MDQGTATRFDVASNSFYFSMNNFAVEGEDEKIVVRQTTYEGRPPAKIANIVGHKAEMVGTSGDLIDRIVNAAKGSMFSADLEATEKGRVVSTDDLWGKAEIREIDQAVNFAPVTFEFVEATAVHDEGGQLFETTGKRLSLWNSEKKEVRSAEEIKEYFGITDKPLEEPSSGSISPLWILLLVPLVGAGVWAYTKQTS